MKNYENDESYNYALKFRGRMVFILTSRIRDLAQNDLLSA